MLNIAIVDDERLFALKLKDLVIKISKNLNIETKIEYYFNGLDLLDTYNKYDLIFLDIEMPIINGISVNEKLNELKKENEIPYVAFVTSKDNMVFDALKSHPFCFIRKSDLYNDIFYCLKNIHQKINTQKQKITIHVGRNDIVINIDDIIYLEKNKNYVIYHTQKEAYSVRIYRYISVIIINLTNLVVFVSLLKINSKSYNLKKTTDVIAFVGIPILTMTVIYLTVYMSIIAGYKEELIPYVIAICISMIVIATVVWYMISKISKDNDIKTQLLTMKLKANMYEKNIIRVNTQINRISDIKHDMKNNIACINALVTNGDVEEAKKLCVNLIENMETVYTPMNTENPILNAVINVEQEKAQNNNIDLKLVVENSMKELKSNTDLISLIGNLCDNAIEYLKSLPVKNRKMELHIIKHNDYNIIVCKNIINSSILNINPNLESNKDDKNNHGKGLNIIKSIVKNYNGTLNFTEKEDWFIATIIF